MEIGGGRQERAERARQPMGPNRLPGMQFHRLMGYLSGLTGLAALLLSFSTHYNGALTRFFVFPIAIGFVVAVVLPIAWAFQKWRHEHLPVALELTMTAVWVAIMWALASILLQAAALTPFALADTTLANIDRRFLIQTVTVVHWISNYPVVRSLFRVAYAALDPLTILAFALPILCGRPEHSRRFLVAVSFSLLLTIGLFAVCPAIGPWTVEGYTPSKNQALVGSYLTALKSGGASRLGELDGIVAFPSFHTVLATLAGVTLWRNRKRRWVTAALAVGVCISTITTGWHYCIDVLGGIAVAVLSLTAAAKVLAAVAVPPGYLWVQGRLAQVEALQFRSEDS